MRTIHWLAAALAATVIVLVLGPTAVSQQQHDHSDVSKPSSLVQTPAAIQSEHKHLHEELAAALAAGGKTAEAATAVEKVLHPHFLEEEKYAMPPLGVLKALADGKVTPDMRPAMEMAQQLKASYPKMLDEHKQIAAALQKLASAAKDENKPDQARFAEQLMLHAQNEEQVLYPATILVGEYLKLKLAGEGR